MNKIKPKILIVEDEWSMRSVLVDRFGLEDFEVLEAGDGEQALKIAFKKKPDVILLDIIMPKMDGITMMQHLRTDPWGEQVPIIFLSNLSSDDEVVKDIKSHHNCKYLVKIDWTLDDVVAKVKSVLS